MSEIVAYVNGSFHAIDKANISVFDRGFLFGDAVYEVAAVLDGKLVDIFEKIRRPFKKQKTTF